MDYTALVREVQRPGHRACDLYRFVDGELLFPIELVAEGFALHVRHHIIKERICLTRIVERQDVRVLQVGGYLDLLQEALAAQNGRQLRPQHLHRNFALVLEVFSEIHGGHATGANLILNGVAVAEGCSETT
jgi:hypothetical protein